MSEPNHIFIELPTGSDGRDRVAINITEIASYRSHTVVSYSYQERVEVVMKNGDKHDCHVTFAEFKKSLNEAWTAAEVTKHVHA